MAIRTRLRTLVITGAAALLLACAGTAYADKVAYAGRGIQNASVLVTFELVGKNVARGSPPFGRGAQMKMFRADTFRFPNCPDVVDASMEFPRDILVISKETGAAKFNASGPGTGPGSEGAQVSIRGHFRGRGESARGQFRVIQAGCSTGWVSWMAKPGG